MLTLMLLITQANIKAKATLLAKTGTTDNNRLLGMLI